MMGEYESVGQKRDDREEATHRLIHDAHYRVRQKEVGKTLLI